MLYENSIYSASLSLNTSQVVLEVKNSLSNAGDVRDSGSIPGWWGRSPGEGNGNTLQYFCLENPIDVEDC